MVPFSSLMSDSGPDQWIDLMMLTLLRLENGTMAYLNFNHKVTDNQQDIHIYGTKGRVLGRSTSRPFMDGELRVKIGDQETVTPVSSRDAYAREIAAFNRAVLEDREPDASGLDGLRSVQLTEAILKSARDGTRIK